MWYAQRATKDTELWTGTRCGEAEETLLHRAWTCRNNALCTLPDVTGSQDLIHEAINGCPEQSAFWLGGLLTGNMLPAKPSPVLRAECNATVVGDFAKILKATGRCGVDGSGGKLFSSNPRLRAVGAGVGAQALGETEEGQWVVEEAYLSSRVPGKQTVPRAEAWAMYLVLGIWAGTYDLEIVTDASYTYSGMDLRNRS